MIYSLRITAACSAELRADAAHLAMALAFGPADAATFSSLGWQDLAGQRYACAAWLVRPQWLALTAQSVQRPGWDTAELIDLAAARRAQAAMQVWSVEGGLPVPAAEPGRLTVAIGMEPFAALAAMGLTSIEEDSTA